MTESSLADWPGESEFPRFLADLMVAELGRLRPGTLVSPAIWRAGGGDLGVDSLEHLRLALAVSTALNFSGAQNPDRLQEMRTFDQWLAETRRVLQTGGHAVCFKTSGSTGEPRFHRHSLAALAQEIAVLAALFGDVERIVVLVPAHHIYGFLFTVLLPQALRRPVVDGRAHSFASLATILRPKDLIVGFPTSWEAATQARLAWPADVEGVSSGAPCPPDVASALRGNPSSDGPRRLVEIYGATETGGIGWRDGPTPFRLFPYWSKVDEDHIAKDSGLHELPDHVSWQGQDLQGQDLLTPARRRDGAVQVGGVNVFPDFVRAVLAAHPDVAEASVRLMRPQEGERLKAFVVPKQANVDRDALRRDLETWLARRLQPAQLPRAFTFGEASPRDTSGKPADWTI
jgi:4-coumarate--CoA ligase (photoactive yellow protein activation family)